MTGAQQVCVSAWSKREAIWTGVVHGIWKRGELNNKLEARGVGAPATLPVCVFREEGKKISMFGMFGMFGRWQDRPEARACVTQSLNSYHPPRVSWGVGYAARRWDPFGHALTPKMQRGKAGQESY